MKRGELIIIVLAIVGAVALIIIGSKPKVQCPPGGLGTKECPTPRNCDVMTMAVPCRDLDYSKPTYYRCNGTNDVWIDYACKGM